MSAIPTTAAPPAETLQQRFGRLADLWQGETAVLSSTTAKVAHHAFREIVSMGQAAIPLVLKRIGAGTGHWHLAMSEITGERPFPPSAVGVG